VQKLDEAAFDRTIEEIKYRYYDCARAILKFRGLQNWGEQQQHRYFKYDPFDIEREIYRKN